MDNVISFPDSMVRSWSVYEKRLRPMLAASGATSNEIDHACAALRPLYLEYAKPKDFDTSNPEALLVELNRWVSEQVFGLLGCVAAREVVLFRLTGGGLS